MGQIDPGEMETKVLHTSKSSRTKASLLDAILSFTSQQKII